jgi:ubiquinone/menaquinone biosynthesis C-methylase UbiE
MALAEIRNGEAVLEVALGTGLTFVEILKANPDGENFGIDLTPAMLEKAIHKAARSRTSHYQIAIGDAYDLQFPDRRFDLLMNSYMFDLLPQKDFAAVLAEFKRVLKPGGRLVLVNVSKAVESATLREFLYRHLPAKVVLYVLGGCRPVRMEKLTQAAGFANVMRTFLPGKAPSEIVHALKPHQPPEFDNGSG